MEEAQPRTPREKAGERSCGGRRQSSGRGDILHSRINRETNWIEGDGTEEGISDAMRDFEKYLSHLNKSTTATTVGAEARGGTIRRQHHHQFNS
jgi:hypothetical protein